VIAGGSAAQAQVADITINVLGTTIRITGLTTSAKAQLSSCDAPPTLTGASSFATVSVNGVLQPKFQNTTVPVTMSLVVGTLAFNQTTIVGNTITVSAMHLSIAGVADFSLGQSVAGASCG
jgi:hypothetical protein